MAQLADLFPPIQAAGTSAVAAATTPEEPIDSEAPNSDCDTGKSDAEDKITAALFDVVAWSMLFLSSG